MSGPRIKYEKHTFGRVERFIGSDFYLSTNLRGRLYRHRSPVKLEHFAAPDRIRYDEAMRGAFTDTSVGSSFGPTWSTHWFRLSIEVPDAWVGEEVRLRWHSGCEAMVWQEGQPLQGLCGKPDRQIRTDFVISKDLQPNQQRLTLYVEMACNGMMGEGDLSEIHPPNPNRYFTLAVAEIVAVDTLVQALLYDFQVLLNLAQNLTDKHRASQAIVAANDMINVCDIGDSQTYLKARDIAKSFFSEKNGDAQQLVHAMGHCHIDCAWLWPYSETIRKCARSWSSTVRLMEEYPDMTFTCSQAQQFQWVKDNYPCLYEKIHKFVKEGRFIPVGGSWVEMDGNLPSGESFVRQVLYGQRFFQEEFGMKCKEFWLPDTFGYSPQLPQIVKDGGMSRFLTQKISWGVNKFPHHSFLWEGLDGSTVLTHFPPGDRYEMTADVKELMRTVNNCEDKGRARNTGYLYGHGDGGGGPTEEMLERLIRLENVDGCPRVLMSSPDKLFGAIEKFELPRLCRWVGELYLEFHQGTYTTQSKTKRSNRKCEFLLHDVEVASVMSLANNNHTYPRDELNRLWKLLLLNQFHDVLPGSSINQVYVDAYEYYRDISVSGTQLLESSLFNTLPASANNGDSSAIVFNTLGWSRTEVIQVPNDAQVEMKKRPASTQVNASGETFAAVTVPSIGYSILKPTDVVPVKVEEKGDVVQLTNGYISVNVDACGRFTFVGLTSPKHSSNSRNALASDCLGNQFVMFEDMPAFWDGWDLNYYHLEKSKLIEDVEKKVQIIERGPLLASVQVCLRVSQVTTIRQTISLNAACPFVRVDAEIDWNEDHKILKVEFPLSVRSSTATYEMQFGHVERPTHFNTSWDWMKFEVCGHKWADISQHNFGVALLNDCKYGYSTHGNVMRLSLLRAPRAPDEHADQGTHHVTYAVMPHEGTFQEAGVIQQAYNLNCPMLARNVMCPLELKTEYEMFRITSPAVIIDAIKLSEVREDAVVIRMFEAYGSEVTAQCHTSLCAEQIHRCNILEEVTDDNCIEFRDSWFQVHLTPFQIQSFLITLA